MGERKALKQLAVLGAALLGFGLFSHAADIPCVWSGVERIVAIGDLHGDYDNLVSILRNPKVGLLDENLRWIGGKTHLVQIGDILDRGDRAKDIFDLLMRLEEEAAAAGGMVHVLLGNHEEATLVGIALNYPDYVSVDQFFAFVPGSFKKAREKEYLARLSPEERDRVKSEGLDLEKDASWRDLWAEILDASKKSKGLDEAGEAYTTNFNRTYGRWLLEKNAVIQINDVIFVHAGIAPRYSTWKLKELNDTFRFELEVLARRRSNPRHLREAFQPRLVYNSESPLRLRAYEQETSEEQMSGILVNLKAGRMVIGHNFAMAGETLSPVVPAGGVIPRFNGKLWMIDTGIGYTLYGGRLYALIIKDGEFDHYAESGELGPAELKSPQTGGGPKSPDEIEKYLKTATPVFVMPGAAGRTDPWKVKMDLEGITRWAQFKYIDRPRPDRIPDSYKYELAAYALCRHLGLGFAPPVVERTINNFPGSLQIFVEDAFRESDRKRDNIQLEDPKAFDEAMADLKVFVNLVYDRWGTERDRDILIQRGTGKVYAVDFSQAFDAKDGTVAGCDIPRCSRALYQKLQRWDRDQIERLLASFLNRDEMRALHARVRAILETIKKQIEERGEDAVLF